MKSSQFLHDLASTEQSIHHFIRRYALGVIILLGIILACFFIYQSYEHFVHAKEKIRNDYIQLQKDMIKNRVLDATSLIESERRNTEESIKKRIKKRVDTAMALANAIYEKNKNDKPEKIQQLIIEAMRPLRWHNGRSYIWICTYDSKGVLAPANPSWEGKSLAHIRDLKGNAVVVNQSELAKKKGEGFSKDYFTKYDKPSINLYPQIAYVRNFGRFNWYFGSAEFIDDYEEELKNELLDRLANMNYGSTYIFITTFDGHALLSNGKRNLRPPYIWDLTDKNGKKLIQEEINLAKQHKEGGYLTYTWYEQSLGQEREYLSYVKNIDEWQWNIGTGVHFQDIEKMTTVLEKEYYTSLYHAIIFVIIIMGLFIVVSSFLIQRLKEKIESILSQSNHQLRHYYHELEELNSTLEERVKTEVQKFNHQEQILIEQSKLASMGEMIDIVAHQWKQPLCVITLLTSDLNDMYAYNELTKETLRHTTQKIDQKVSFLVETLDTFRNFLKPEFEINYFSAQESILPIISMLYSALEKSGIILTCNVSHDFFLHGKRCEFQNVILNLINNARDALFLTLPEKPFIHIVIDTHLISVEDNAGGIPKMLQETIFTRKFTTKEDSGGSGIGLYLTKIVIEENMHGKVTVENTSFGAKFTLNFLPNS